MVFPDFQTMRVLEEQVCIYLFPLSAKSSFYFPAFEISRSCRTAPGYEFDANNCRLPTFYWESVAETVHALLVPHGSKGEIFHKYLLNYLPIEGFEFYFTDFYVNRVLYIPIMNEPVTSTN